MSTAQPSARSRRAELEGGAAAVMAHADLQTFISKDLLLLAVDWISECRMKRRDKGSFVVVKSVLILWCASCKR